MFDSLQKTLTLLAMLLLSSCNASPPEKKSPATPEPIKSGGEATVKSPDEELKLFQQRSAVMNALCAELQNLHNKAECVGLKSLVERESVASCLAAGQSQSLKTVYEVELSSAKPVYLSVDPSFSSRELIESGKRVPVLWVNKGDKNILPPRLADIRLLKFLDKDGSSVSVSAFKLFVNGIEAPVSLVDSDKAVDFAKLQSQYAESDCRMGQSDVDKIKQSALANASSTASPEGDVKALTEILDSQIKSLESELTKDAKRGCWVSQKIETMEIEIVGGVTPVQDGCKHQHIGQEGSPDEVVMKIAGRDVSFNKGQLASGRLVLQRTDFSDKNVSELKDFSFAIKGRRVQNVRTPGCGKTLFYQTELDRPVIRSIKIKVNGKLAYSRDDFESKFNQTGSYFGGGDIAYASDGTFRTFESKLQSNGAYLDLLKSDDCR